MPGIMKKNKTSLQRLFPVCFHVGPVGQNITVKETLLLKRMGNRLSVLLSLKLQLQPTEQLQTSMVISLFQFRSTLL